MLWHCDTFLSLWVCICVCTLQAWQSATFCSCRKLAQSQWHCILATKTSVCSILCCKNSRHWGTPKSANDIWNMSFYHFALIHFDNQPICLVFLPKPFWMSSSTNLFMKKFMGATKWLDLCDLYSTSSASTCLLLVSQKGECTLWRDGVGFRFPFPSLCSFNRPPNPYFISSQIYNHS